MRAYFGRPPQDAKDTPQRRATDLKSLLEVRGHRTLTRLLAVTDHELFVNSLRRTRARRATTHRVAIESETHERILLGLASQRGPHEALGIPQKGDRQNNKTNTSSTCLNV